MWSRLLDINVPLCEYGVLGSFPVAFRAGAGETEKEVMNLVWKPRRKADWWE